MIAELSTMSGYSTDAWPRQVERLLADHSYQDEICHLCIARRDGLGVLSGYYAGKLDEFVAPYTDQLMRSGHGHKITARSEVQQLLGLSRWAREAELFSIIKQIFPDHVVLREASPTWLGRLRLDVYVPELALAFEHQGEQHYRPVDVFGGQEAFKKTVERDDLKQRLCAENSIHLVEVRFDAPLTLPSLRSRLKRFL